MRKWPSVLVLVAATVLLAGCNLAFLSNAASNSNSSSETYTYSWSKNNTVYSCYDGSGALVWYDIYVPNNSTPSTIARYLANNTLVYTDAYEYDSYNNKTLDVYFDSSNTLQSIERYSYETYTASGTKKERQVEAATFTVSSSGAYSLYSAEYLSYDSSLNKTVQDVWTGSTNTVSSVTAYSYDSSGNLSHVKTYGSALRLLNDTTYGLYNGTSEPFLQYIYTGADSSASKQLQLAACAAKSGSRGASAARALTVPTTLPAFPTEPAFTLVDTNTVLSVSTVWNYDSYGNFAATLNANNYPTAITRTDSRLSQSVTIDASWDSYNRLTEKNMYYGSTDILDVKINYGSNTQYANGGWNVTELDFSGASLLLPIAIGITYNSSNLPDTIAAYTYDPSTKTRGTKLYYLTYTYTNTATSASSGIDLGLLHFGGVITAVKNYTGSGTYLGKYVFDYSNKSQLLISSLASSDGTDNNDTNNGKFVIAYNSAGQDASFTSYNSSGGIAWQYQYSYEDVQSGASALVGELGLTQSNVTSASTTVNQFLSNYDASGILTSFLKQ
jgi:hypothetical protein